MRILVHRIIYIRIPLHRIQLKIGIMRNLDIIIVKISNSLMKEIDSREYIIRIPNNFV